MNSTVPDLDLPAITTPDRPVPRTSSEDALRWRIAKQVGQKALPHEKVLGPPFEWIESVRPTKTLP